MGTALEASGAGPYGTLLGQADGDPLEVSPGTSFGASFYTQFKVPSLLFSHYWQMGKWFRASTGINELD